MHKSAVPYWHGNRARLSSDESRLELGYCAYNTYKINHSDHQSDTGSHCSIIIEKGHGCDAIGISLSILSMFSCLCRWGYLGR